jgi:bifunctional non-homologous end joining protein LigD
MDKNAKQLRRERPTRASLVKSSAKQSSASGSAGSKPKSRSAGRAAAALPDTSLKAYEAKRDFTKTEEPGPKIERGHRTPIFVIQEHHATRLHYDFRLEADGVLKSWAVTREPTMDPSVKRLAVQVEDHPLAYANFRGDIPKGEYGAGHVEIWDKGTYTAAGAKDILRGLEAGKIEIEVDGDKLKGAFALVRMAGRGRGENWLLIKMNDRHAKRDPGGAGGSGRAKSAKGSRSPGRNGAAAGSKRASAPAGAEGKVVVKGEPPDKVEFTSEDKVMFPEVGVTKGDVLQFYADIAPRLLPHLRDRPITLERLPDGLNPGAPRFWQKNTPAHYPGWVPRVNLPAETGKPIHYALVNDVETLLYLVNQGALTFHIWFSRVGSLDRPEFVLFDLDPGGAAFTDVVKIAKTLHGILDEQKVESSVKTSGKTGLHVLVPWRRDGGYDEARAWAMENARRLVGELPDIATTERSKAEREGRVYVDVMQNARGHHAVPPYVLRATPQATVSTPLDWKELTAGLDPKRFNVKTIFQRLKKQKADPMAALAG